MVLIFNSYKGIFFALFGSILRWFGSNSTGQTTVWCTFCVCLSVTHDAIIIRKIGMLEINMNINCPVEFEPNHLRILPNNVMKIL